MDSLNVEFFNDVKAFFSREKEGNLGPYIYGTPDSSMKDDLVRGEEAYHQLIYEYPNYYLYKDEVNLIQKVANQLAAHVPPKATVIELGPGTEKAFVGKTLPFLKAIEQLHQYVPVDLCDKYLVDARKIIEKELPHVKVEAIKTDFFKDISWVQNHALPVMFFKGSTIGNLSQQQCIDFFQAVFPVLGSDGRLIIGVDANQDKNSLAQAYDNQLMSNLMLSIFHLINRDLPVRGFDANAFTYKFDWVSDEYCVKHKAISTKAQNFELNSTPVNLKEGEEFHLLSSYKYPVEVFQNLAKQSGLSPLDCFIDDRKRMAIYVFQP